MSERSLDWKTTILAGLAVVALLLALPACGGGEGDDDGSGSDTTATTGGSGSGSSAGTTSGGTGGTPSCSDVCQEIIGCGAQATQEQCVDQCQQQVSAEVRSCIGGAANCNEVGACLSGDSGSSGSATTSGGDGSGSGGTSTGGSGSGGSGTTGGTGGGDFERCWGDCPHGKCDTDESACEDYSGYDVSDPAKVCPTDASGTYCVRTSNGDFAVTCESGSPTVDSCVRCGVDYTGDGKAKCMSAVTSCFGQCPRGKCGRPDSPDCDETYKDFDPTDNSDICPEGSAGDQYCIDVGSIYVVECTENGPVEQECPGGCEYVENTMEASCAN